MEYVRWNASRQQKDLGMAENFTYLSLSVPKQQDILENNIIHNEQH